MSAPTSSRPAPRLRPLSAFTLLEVIVALGVFAVGMVGVIGLLGSVTKSGTAAGEAAAAARVADSVQARLRSLPFTAVAALLQDPAAVQKNDALGNYNPNDGTHPAVLFAKLNGEVGIYDSVKTKLWLDSSGATVANADKFFEIELIRQTALSPAGTDAAAAMLAYTMRVRWPSWLPSANGAGVQVGAGQPGTVTFDHGKQQVAYFSGSVRR